MIDLRILLEIETEKLEMFETSYSATYSAEDNKLRLYASGRMPENIFKEGKALGLKWAPKQNLFVFPAWTPKREDFCLKLSNSILPEETTMLERAEEKCDRLDEIAEKNVAKAKAYWDYADKISERFHMGQPILVGHHSEASARRDQKRMENATRKSIESSDKADYFAGKVKGVIRNANYKNNAGVRLRRCKSILTGLRDKQRDINLGHLSLDAWSKLKGVEYGDSAKKMFNSIANTYIENRSLNFGDRHGTLLDTPSNFEAELDRRIDLAKAIVESNHIKRWVDHLLNRYFYEVEVGSLESNCSIEDLDAPMIRSFLRTFGVFKPQVEEEGDDFIGSSVVPFPQHLKEIQHEALSKASWLDVIKSFAFRYAGRKSKKPKLLNIRCDSHQGTVCGSTRELRVVEMTKRKYNGLYEGDKGTCVSPCGNYRFRTAYGSYLGKKYNTVGVFLIDSKEHPIPHTSQDTKPV